MKKLLTILFLTGFLFAFAAHAQKTLTNDDLEKFRRERVKNDPDDERERSRLGLPSRKEQQQRRDADAKSLREAAAKLRREQARKEDFWQTQIFPVRSELIAVEAEINYLQARINDLPAPQTQYVVGYSPYFYQPGCCFNQTGAGISGNVSFGSKPRVSIGINAAQTSVRRQTIETVSGGNANVSVGRFGFPRGVFLVPYTTPNYQNWTRQQLVSRLYALEQTRAGLFAQFENLRDAAGRDGVQID